MQTLFSEHWHLVKHVKPKLREAVDVFPRRLARPVILNNVCLQRRFDVVIERGFALHRLYRVVNSWKAWCVRINNSFVGVITVAIVANQGPFVNAIHFFML